MPGVKKSPSIENPCVCSSRVLVVTSIAVVKVGAATQFMVDKVGEADEKDESKGTRGCGKFDLMKGIFEIAFSSGFL